MSLRTFHIEPDALGDGSATLQGEELRHARLVLRLVPGDEVRLLDGVGGVFIARVRDLSLKEDNLVLLERREEAPSPFSLTLALGLLKGDRFEWALQKAVELGASAFIPLLTERSEVRPGAGWKKGERLQRIIVSACKQCGRARVPRLHPPTSLRDLDTAPYRLPLALWEGAHQGADTVLPPPPAPGDALLVVGPEGGFTPPEARLLDRKGLGLLGLGPRILRAETAAVAGTTLLQYLYGDLGVAGALEGRVR